MDGGGAKGAGEQSQAVAPAVGCTVHGSTLRDLQTGRKASSPFGRTTEESTITMVWEFTSSCNLQRCVPKIGCSFVKLCINVFLVRVTWDSIPGAELQ